jgi:hypothetical protein
MDKVYAANPICRFVEGSCRSRYDCPLNCSNGAGLKHNLSYDGSDIFIAIRCSDARLKKEFLQSRIVDWMNGVGSINLDIESEVSKNMLLLAVSERRRHVHQILLKSREHDGIDLGRRAFSVDLFSLHTALSHSVTHGMYYLSKGRCTADEVKETMVRNGGFKCNQGRVRGIDRLIFGIRAAILLVASRAKHTRNNCLLLQGAIRTVGRRGFVTLVRRFCGDLGQTRRILGVRLEPVARHRGSTSTLELSFRYKAQRCLDSPNSVSVCHTGDGCCTGGISGGHLCVSNRCG